MSLGVLLGALDPSFDVTVVGTTPAIVEWVASFRPSSRVRVLEPVRSKLDAAGIRSHVRAIREIAPDVLHINLDNPWTAPYGMLAGALTRTPMLAMLHQGNPPWRRRQKWLVRPVARRVRRYVAVSSELARVAEYWMKFEPGTVRVVHNGSPAPPSAVAPVSSVPGELRIGAVGRLAPEKGIDVLMSAMGSVPSARLLVVGDGPHREALEVLAKAVGVADRVEFLGWVAQPWSAKVHVDVLAMPSFHEGLPMVLVEAMLAGLPVVATRVGGIPEVVVDGANGLLVEPRDIFGLSEALRRMADDPALRHAMASKARADAIEGLTDAVMAANYEALYDEIVA